MEFDIDIYTNAYTIMSFDKDIRKYIAMDLHKTDDISSVTDDEIVLYGYSKFELLAMTIIDKKMDSIKKYYTKKQNLTEGQIERYSIKYKLALLALNNNTTAKEMLKREADILQIDVDEYIQLIKEKGDAWERMLNEIVPVLEGIRIKVQQLFFNKQFIQALYILKELIIMNEEINIDTLSTLF